MSYRLLPRAEYQEAGYSITSLREQDMEDIRLWRNGQIDVLRQRAPLTPEDQRRYYRDSVAPGFAAAAPRQILFSFLHQGACIGYGGLTNLDWESGRAEVSFLVDSQRAQDPALYARDFSAFLGLLKRVAFEELPLQRLFTETYDLRPVHVRVLEESGFAPEGRMRRHVRIQGRLVDSLIHGCLKEGAS